MVEDKPGSPKKKEIKVAELKNIGKMNDEELEAYSNALWQKLTKKK